MKKLNNIREDTSMLAHILNVAMHAPAIRKATSPTSVKPGPIPNVSNAHTS